MVNANDTGSIISNRMPYDLTNTGFSHVKAGSASIIISYIAVGKKV